MTEKKSETSQNHQNSFNEKSASESALAENFSVGELLKFHREKLGLDIKKIARYLNVKEKDIISLENNDIEKIARNIYVAGLIKSYAKYLKIEIGLIDNKIQELPLRSNIEIKKHTLLNIGDDNELSPSKDLVFNSLIISAILIFIFLIIFSSLENNVALINTDGIISDIQKINN